MAVAIGLALLFAFTNGIHDASNAIAALVATRAARPLQAVVLAAVFNVLGPLVVGSAVADTIGGIVSVGGSVGIEVIGAGLFAAVLWNATTWALGLPSSSGHALVGGLVGAALAAGGSGAIQWGGIEHGHPVGVLGTLIALALAPVLGALAAFVVIRGLRRAARRGTRHLHGPVVGAEWGLSAALAFGHGANDAQKSVGVIAALLVADGRVSSLSSPTWAVVACAVALTLGTALGGWSIVKTVGRRIYRITPVDGMATQAASAGVILGASLVGAPVSTTQVVASSVLGVGGGRRRWRHVNWAVVRHIALGWVVTMPGHGGRRRRGGQRVEVVVMRRRRWFLPESPDLLGMLRHQLNVTIAGMDAFAAWAGGDDAAAATVRDYEHRADDARRDLHTTLKDAFVTPLEPEDLFALSRGLDRILNQAKDLVRESEVMECAPDAALAEMATLLAAAVRGLDDAIAGLEPHGGDTTLAADAAIKQARRLERVYRSAMAELLDVDDLREVMARRELYRRCSRMGESAVDVAERVLYAAVKES